jgi:2-haloacid dehalogenase
MKNAIIFDFGGVLIDWDPRHLYRQLIDDEETMEQFLTTICTNEWQARQNLGRRWSEAVAELVEQYPEHRFLIEAYWDRWPEMLGDAFEGTVAIVGELRHRGVKLYGLTNWSAETFPYARERFDFIGWFDGIIVSGEAGIAKPSPKIFHHLFQRFALQPGDAIFIDDHQPNIEAAKSLGLESHHFRSPQHLRDYLAAASLL